MKPLALGLSLGAVLFVGGLSFAQNPMEDISSSRHPNLAAAQHMIRQAYDRIGAAQSENRYDMQGHAKRAKELLQEASRELKLAAQADNAGHR